MQKPKPSEIEIVEQIITDYLKERDFGTPDQIYSTCRERVPYFVLREVIFDMYKKHILRRKLLKVTGANYCLAERLPNYGTLYQKRRPSKKEKKQKEQVKLSLMDSVREGSKVYKLDQLLKNVRQSNEKNVVSALPYE